MRAKTPQRVVTFASTSDALAMEAAARERGIPGRVIPVPSEIDAGCGLAWCAPTGIALEGMLEAAGVQYEAIYVIEMY